METGAEEKHLHTIAALAEAGVLKPGSLTPAFDKPAGHRCPHQRHGKGCKIYAHRPLGCRMWSCLWLLNSDTADLPRPDRSHYVIDMSPDFIRTTKESGETIIIPVIQVWIDPDYPDAHRDPRLRAYLQRRAQKNGYAAIIRLNDVDAFALFAPPFTGGKWIEKHSAVRETTHTCEEKVEALGALGIAVSTIGL
jgi:hypothetical protein